MTQRIFRSICFVAMAVFLASMVLIMGVLYDYFSRVQRSQLRMQLELAAQGVSREGADYLNSLKVKDYRITWISTDGTVLFDSRADSGDMENHLEREEIKKAVSAGYGESERYSATLMDRSLYAAGLLSDGTVLRLSIAQSSILTLVLGMAQPICIVFIIAVVVSVLLAVRLSRSVVRPLNEIDLDNPLSNEGYDELAPLLRRIDSQQRQLRAQKSQLEQKQSELDTIIDSMSEGMILLNERGRIISVNSAATALLGGGRAGEDLLTVSRNLDLQDSLSRALSGERTARVADLKSGRYQIDASPILSEGKTVGAALCFFDVTEKERAEQTRREFTANVSHELKTPLHSISGYAELLKNGMVKQDDTAGFGERIYAQAQRMIRLVEDIISLSHLDEGARDMEREDVNLYAAAEQAVSGLGAEAEEKRVELTLCGGAAVINGVPQLLYSIVYNLCDNAIKYNREGGRVSVSVTDEGAQAVLSVSDTGIGIAPEEQERVFERFYRVDKSRSKAAGGTGLGLSIVKHAAMIHGAAIEVDSAPGQGTTVTVRFPKHVKKAARPLL